MRLIVTLLWLLAAACWTPWALLALRLGVDLALGLIPATAHAGHSWAGSPYVSPVADALVVQFGWPHWETGRFIGGWLTARVGSIFPWLALTGCALTAAGWKLYWIAEEGRLPHGAGTIAASILLPPLAPLLMYRDARRRYAAAEAELEEGRRDALARVSH